MSFFDFDSSLAGDSDYLKVPGTYQLQLLKIESPVLNKDGQPVSAALMKLHFVVVGTDANDSSKEQVGKLYSQIIWNFDPGKKDYWQKLWMDKICRLAIALNVFPHGQNPTDGSLAAAASLMASAPWGYVQGRSIIASFEEVENGEEKEFQVASKETAFYHQADPQIFDWVMSNQRSLNAECLQLAMQNDYAFQAPGKMPLLLNLQQQASQAQPVQQAVQQTQQLVQQTPQQQPIQAQPQPTQQQVQPQPSQQLVQTQPVQTQPVQQTIQQPVQQVANPLNDLNQVL